MFTVSLREFFLILILIAVALGWWIDHVVMNRTAKSLRRLVTKWQVNAVDLSARLKEFGMIVIVHNNHELSLEDESGKTLPVNPRNEAGRYGRT